MHYSPVNYHSLGRVYPREKLREPFQPPPRSRAWLLPAVGIGPVRPVFESGNKLVFMAVDPGRHFTAVDPGRHFLGESP